MKHFTLITLTVALLLGIYATPMIAGPIHDGERGYLSVKMVNLSSAVDAYFDDLPEDTTIESDDIILKNATRHDTSLLATEFAPYLLKVQRQNNFAVVLMCTKDGKQAIMEDAGCSARLDRQVTQDAACDFTLIVNSGCEVEGADH